MQAEQPDQLFQFNPAIRINLNIKSEVRENGDWKPLESNIFFNKNPEFCKFIIDSILDQKNYINFSDLPENYFNFLLQAGILIKKPPIPSGNDFQCIISDHINNLVPYSTDISQVKKNIENYRINPQIYIQENEETPFLIRERLPFSDFFPKNFPIFWIEEPKTKIIMPYWFTGEKKELIYRLINENLVITDLTEQVLQQLIMANILIPGNYLSGNFNEELATMFNNVNQTLISKGFVILKEIINPLQIGALRKYFRVLEEKDCFSRDFSLWERDLLRDDPVLKFIHHQIGQFINKFTPQKVWPTYGVLSVYRPGAILLKHIDSKQQDWNMSLSMDMVPEFNESDAWPIFLEVKGIVHEIKLGLGDGVLYRGSEIPHWRNKLPENHKQTVCLFHFVEDNFPGS